MVFKGILDKFGRMYRKKLHSDLNKFGLRYHDLLMETDPVVMEAVRRLPPRERALRQMRMKRALDLEMKQTALPEHIQGKQGDHYYLKDLIRQIQEENLEKQLQD